MQLTAYHIGAVTPEWGRGTAQNLQFIVTENCNLRCKYCYITHGNTGISLEFDTAKKFIDYVIENTTNKSPNVILDFIGAETLLEVDLIDQITDYFKWITFERGLDWYWNYRISICTNGVNYGTPKVQRYIQKNKNKISMTITLDGTKEKHDLQRVFPDGSGSYDTIIKNVPLWLSEFVGNTKVTFAHSDLPLLKDSIIHLWNLGIRDVSANVVFEDVWESGDDKIFENQIILLADYIIDNKLLYNHYCTLFSDSIGEPYGEEQLSITACGAGRMLAVGPGGKLYPCLRYKDYSLNNRNEICIGNLDDGIDFDKVRPFRTAMFRMQSDSECLNCEVATGCGFCQGFNYDSADTDTNFQRAKYICKMHKARVRANNYFWARLYNEFGIERLTYRNEHKKMYFILDNDYVDTCEMRNNDSQGNKMDIAIIQEGLDYCRENFYFPIFLHSRSNPDFSLFNRYKTHRITHIISAKHYNSVSDYRNYILVYDNTTLDCARDCKGSVILNVAWDNVDQLSTYVASLFEHVDRINLNMQGQCNNDDIDMYENQLKEISELLVEYWNNTFTKELNCLTDVFFSKEPSACYAGTRAIAVSPLGNLFTCPIEYSNKGTVIGSLHNGLDNFNNPQVYTLAFSPLCEKCPATHCVKCYVKNKKTTGEVNVPPLQKCSISLCERRVSIEFKKAIEVKGLYNLPDLTAYDYADPLDAFEDATHVKLGYKVSCHQ